MDSDLNIDEFFQRQEFVQFFGDEPIFCVDCTEEVQY
jgi:hypothetical protein